MIRNRDPEVLVYPCWTRDDGREVGSLAILGCYIKNCFGKGSTVVPLINVSNVQVIDSMNAWT